MEADKLVQAKRTMMIMEKGQQKTDQPLVEVVGVRSDPSLVPSPAVDMFGLMLAKKVKGQQVLVQNTIGK